MLSTKKSLYDIVVPEITIPSWAQNLLSVLREHNLATYQHSVNVSLLMYEFANYIAPGSDICKKYYVTGLFHDVGKICIENRILDFDGPLSVCDRNIMNMHAEYSARLCSEFCDDVVEAIRNHHKFFYELSMHNVMEMAIHTIDVYDALRQPRPYSAAIDKDTVLEYLYERSGHEFSPYTLEIIEEHLLDFSYKRFTVE